MELHEAYHIINNIIQTAHESGKYRARMLAMKYLANEEWLDIIYDMIDSLQVD